jgi:hypothetical protein
MMNSADRNHIAEHFGPDHEFAIPNARTWVGNWTGDGRVFHFNQDALAPTSVGRNSWLALRSMDVRIKHSDDMAPVLGQSFQNGVVQFDFLIHSVSLLGGRTLLARRWGFPDRGAAATWSR